MKQYRIGTGKAIINNDGSITWIGIMAIETRHMINKSLRDQGISDNLQGVEFVNKCITDYLEMLESKQLINN